jgi:hypothetical protein
LASDAEPSHVGKASRAFGQVYRMRNCICNASRFKSMRIELSATTIDSEDEERCTFVSRPVPFRVIIRPRKIPNKVGWDERV